MSAISDEELWVTLAADGRYDLIEKLQKALNEAPGYGTLVVNKEGFSDNDRIHNMVLGWLKGHPEINVLDIVHEIGNLEEALKGRDYDE